MKRTTAFFLFVLTIILPFTVFADFNKTKIAILDFQLQGDHFPNEDMGAIVAEWFTTAMVQEGRFDVVERQMLRKVLHKQKLAVTGVVDASSATQIGKLLGVKVIISGSVMKLGDTTEINARIIDVKNGSIIAAENIKGEDSTQLQDLVGQMARKIIKNFPLEGYIVNRNDESVTLDLGLRTGVRRGMRFIVYKEGQVIKHPKTGEILEVERKQTGVIVITRVMQNICKATIVEEKDPGSIDYGQLVKSLVDTGEKVASLTINTRPQNATVRILNIGPRYHRGMVLKPGSYHVEVSAPGYKTKKRWINVKRNKDETILFDLVRNDTRKQRKHNRIATQPATPTYSPAKADRRSLTARQATFINMLNSPSIRENRDAAKRIVRARLSDTVVLDTVERLLLRKFRTSNTRNQVDTMAWYCKALGASGVKKYRATLKMVATQAPQKKLQGYALKSLRAY